MSTATDEFRSNIEDLIKQANRLAMAGSHPTNYVVLEMAEAILAWLNADEDLTAAQHRVLHSWGTGRIVCTCGAAFARGPSVWEDAVTPFAKHIAEMYALGADRG